MRKTMVSLLVVSALSGMAYAQSGPAVENSANPAVEISIAFVNMERLVEEHPLTRARRDAIQAQMRTRLDEMRAQIEQMEGMRDAGSVYVEGSSEQLELQSKMRRLEANLKLEKRLIQAEFQVEIVKATRDIYAKCKEAVATLAKERNISVVAMVSDSPLRGRTQTELVGDILTRPFLYHDASLDITDEVLKRLQ
jgi:Skp family chaperone for outer membrane proteins